MARQLSQEKTEAILAQQSSNRSQTAWCKENGINVKTFSNWKRKYLEQQGVTAPTPEGWATVSVAGPRQAVATQPGGMDVTIGKYAVHVCQGTERSSFRMICEELSRLC